MTNMRANRAHACMIGNTRVACERAHVLDRISDRYRASGKAAGTGNEPVRRKKVSLFLTAHAGYGYSSFPNHMRDPKRKPDGRLKRREPKHLVFPALGDQSETSKLVPRTSLLSTPLGETLGTSLVGVMCVVIIPDHDEITRIETRSLMTEI